MPRRRYVCSADVPSISWDITLLFFVSCAWESLNRWSRPSINTMLLHSTAQQRSMSDCQTVRLGQTLSPSRNDSLLQSGHLWNFPHGQVPSARHHAIYTWESLLGLLHSWDVDKRQLCFCGRRKSSSMILYVFYHQHHHNHHQKRTFLLPSKSWRMKVRQ